VRKGRAGARTPFTFPEPGAYKIAISGRVKRKPGWRWFHVAFAIRAETPPA
jgi:hypothetical protein